MANKRRVILYIISFVLLFIFTSFELIIHYFFNKQEASIDPYFQMLKSITYISFIAIYMFYMKSKLNDKRIIRGVMLVLTLLICWNIFKIIRWNYDGNKFVEKFLWYLYYFPIIFIPISYFYLFTSISFFHTWKKRAAVSSIVGTGVLLLIFVCTNSLHNLVFKIKDNGDYSYNFGYILVMAFCFVLSVVTLTMSVIGANRGRALTKKGLVVAGAELTIITIYLILYAFRLPQKTVMFNDMTSAVTIFILAFNNSMIYCGLLPVSLEHRKIFYKSDLRLVLTDINGKIFDKTKSLSNINEDIIHKMQDKQTMMDNDILITKKRIRYGYIYSEKDLSTIINLRNEIENSKKNLEERIQLKLKTKEIQEKIIKEKYRNELYNNFNEKVKEVSKDIKVIEESKLDNESKIKQISLILIYLKRTCIFSIFKDKDEIREANDLTLALHELIEYLKKLDINCNILFTEQYLTNKNILDIYVWVYSLIDIARKNNYKDLFFRISKDNNNIEITLSIDNATYIPGLDNQVIEDSTLIVKKVIS